MHKKILVVIAARGGSKGVYRKNIREVNGKPLIAYCIEAALGARARLYKIIVSTEDKEIAEIAKQQGAQVPFLRPKELATDEATSLPVVQHALKTVELEDRVTIDWTMLIQPTNPLITVEDVIGALGVLEKYGDQASSVVSVVDAVDTHPAKALKIENGCLFPFMGEKQYSGRRQNLSSVYRRNGCIYMTSRKTLLEENDLYGKNVMPYKMPKERSLDIDTEFDLRLADFILRDREGKT